MSRFKLKILFLAGIGLLATAVGTLGYAAISTTYVPTAVSFPSEVAVAPDGNVWFTEGRDHANNIVKRASNGNMTKYVIPTAAASPRGIATDSSGNIWFAESGGLGKLGKLVPGTGTFTEYPTPSPNGEPFDVAVRSNGDVWFTLRAVDRLAVRFADGTWGQVQLPQGSAPQGIAVDKSGNVWVAATGNDRIYEWTTGKALRYWQLAAGSGPADITVDDTGNAWFTKRDADAIGRILPTLAIAEYAVGGQGVEPFGIHVYRKNVSSHATDPVWFTRTGSVSSVTACGLGDEYALDATFDPVSVAVDSAGTAWFADIRGNRVGKGYPSTSGLTLNSATLGWYPSSASLSGRLMSGSTALSGKTVKIRYRQPGGVWKVLSYVTTNSTGYFGKTVLPTKNTQYAADFAGSGGYPASSSKPKCVEVVPSVTATYSTGSLYLGGTVKITGGLRPVHPGSEIKLERYTSGSWITVSTGKLNSYSNYTFWWKPAAKGTYPLRVTFRGDADHRWQSTGVRYIAVK